MSKLNTSKNKITKGIRRYNKNYCTNHDEKEIKNGKSIRNLYSKQSISQNYSINSTNKHRKYLIQSKKQHQKKIIPFVSTQQNNQIFFTII